jgi:hypothetical protein
MSPEERSLSARIAAHTLHSQVDGLAITEKARKTFLDSFLDQVDPGKVLPPDERERRAKHLHKAHMARLALKSAQARRARKAGAA